MSVEIKGPMLDPAFMKKVGDELRRRLDAEVMLAAVNTANNARTAVQSGGQGIVYEKYNPRRTHRASSPGSAPATDTGRLVASITHQKVSDGVLVGSKVVYSKWLEYGTREMGERPFLRPALKKARQELVKRVQNLVGAKSVQLGKVIK